MKTLKQAKVGETVKVVKLTGQDVIDYMKNKGVEA